MDEAGGEGRGQALWRRAQEVIPGGGQLLSKRAERFLPDLWPSYYDRVDGCRVWDLDGHVYYDFAQMGVGSCVLGYKDPDVDAAVSRALDAGVMASLNCPEEVELAEVLIGLHPWAGMVRYARSGGEACAIAVRAARAATGRSKILFCGYHGWHDWYLAANLEDPTALDKQLLPGLEPLGVPRQLAGSAHPFRYNDLGQLQALMALHGPDVAAVVMEPRRSEEPAPDFLARVREITSKAGVVLVFDEVTSGFRLAPGGIHRVMGVDPDVAVLGKSLGNGYAVSAVVGTEAVLESLTRSFVSSTFWTERLGLAAALATIEKYRRLEVGRHLVASGNAVSDAWRAAAEATNLRVKVSGIPPLTTLTWLEDEPLVAQTLYAQAMLERGFLAGAAVYTTYAYTEEVLAAFRDAVQGAFQAVAEAFATGHPKGALRGSVIQPGFGRLN